ncbi:MAG: hypothetical protein EOO38_12990 [Cytophagaceae bacterium]|nr:MAG: hypothetical protein EOO38_12990 [Cytophagaceae bacterium]
MNRTSREAQMIEQRFMTGDLFEEPGTSTIVAVHANQRFFRTTEDVFVRHDVRPGIFYTLDSSQKLFTVRIAPQVPDQTRPFTKEDLLRDETNGEWILRVLANNAGEVQSAVIGSIAGAGAGAVGTLLFPPAAPATVPTMLAPLGLSLGGSAIVGGGVIGGLIGSQAAPDRDESPEADARS